MHSSKKYCCTKLWSYSSNPNRKVFSLKNDITLLNNIYFAKKTFEILK